MRRVRAIDQGRVFIRDGSGCVEAVPEARYAERQGTGRPTFIAFTTEAVAYLHTLNVEWLGSGGFDHGSKLQQCPLLLFRPLMQSVRKRPPLQKLGPATR